MSEQKFAFAFDAPAVLVIALPGDKEANIDIYEALRMLAVAEQHAEEGARVGHILDWLTDKTGLQREHLAEGNALLFHDTIVSIVERLNAERKKKAASIACSPAITQASPATTEVGQT